MPEIDTIVMMMQRSGTEKAVADVHAYHLTDIGIWARGGGWGGKRQSSQHGHPPTSTSPRFTYHDAGYKHVHACAFVRMRAYVLCVCAVMHGYGTSRRFLTERQRWAEVG